MPRLFLSHAGVDSESARALKERMLAAPACKAAGLEVWFDKDDLKAGEMWQRQLEEAIGWSSAFAVLVGSRGVVNWVEAEVRLALSRAMTEPDYRFIPILAAGAPGPESLPGFARQFQGVRSLDSDITQFEKLVAAVLGDGTAGRHELEAEPFFGLRAIDESRSYLFLGREHETEELLTRVYEQPLVLVSGDSGSGKSSLVRAGLVPRFRGGALAGLKRDRPLDAIWNVVITRPRARPWTELGNAVEKTAKSYGLSLTDCGTLASWAASRDADQARRALRCDLPAEQVRTLLVVDQFEELVTITPEADRAAFIEFLLGLADPGDDRFRIVLTMRHDYVNLCNAFESLRPRLDANDRRARYLLGRMSDDGLRRIVTEPLRLAGISASEREGLAADVLKDVGQRAGDLALVQMALTETWRARAANDGQLSRAYVAVGRVEGALAGAAEQVRTRELAKPDHVALAPLLDSVLVRTVRLGDTGGATRRVAARAEFDDERWRLVQLLASEDGKRLLILGGSDAEPTVEIAHEALVTAWPYFQALLQSVADDKRVFDALIPKGRDWAAAEDRARVELLATGAELEHFQRLLSRRATWLSVDEIAFVIGSREAAARRKHRETWLRRAVAGFALLMLVAAGAAGWFALGLSRTLDRANRALAVSLWNRLDFASKAASDDELNALWEVRVADQTMREAFRAELSTRPERVDQVGRNPGPIFRAVELRWTPAETEAMLALVLKGLAGTDVEQRRRHAAALRVMAGDLGTASENALDVVSTAMTRTTNPGEMSDLASTLLAIRSPLTDQQAQATLGAVFKAFDDVANMLRGNQREALRAAIEALARKFTPEQVHTAVLTILKVLDTARNSQNETAAAVSLDPLLYAVETMGAKLGAELANAVLHSLMNAVSIASERFALDDLAGALTALPVSMSEEQAQVVVGAAFKARARSDDIDLTDDGARALVKLAPMLSGERARALRARVLKITKSWLDSTQVVAVVAALPLPLEDEHLKLVLTNVKTFARSKNAIMLEWPRTAISLAPKLTIGQAETAMNEVTDIHTIAQEETLEGLSEFIRRLPVRPTNTQSRLIVEAMMDRLRNARRVGTLITIAQAMEPFPVAFSDTQSKALLDAVSAMGDETSQKGAARFARTIEALAGKLNSEHVQPALEVLVKSRFQTKDSVIVPAAFASAARALVKALPMSHTSAGLATAKSFLGWARSDEDAVPAAEALVTVLRRSAPADRIVPIVEALKYPSAAGEATRVLLDALHEAAPDAPGKDAGLQANLDWLARAHPTLDHDAPPACPRPLQEGLACPSAVP